MAIKKYVSLEKLEKYDELLKAKIANDDAATLESANAYADSLASNYDAAGSAASALEAAKAHADGKDTAIQAAQAAAEAAQSAAEAADGKADAAQGDVDALETLVGQLPEGTTATTIVEYVNKKTEGIATDAALGELNSQVSGLQTTVQGIAADYLKGEDKTALEGQITAVQTAVNTEKSRAEGVEAGLDARIKAVEDDHLTSADKTALEKAVSDETARADAAEKANAAAIKAIADDYLTSTDKDGLQAQIDLIMNNPDTKDVVDSITEFTNYITEHGTVAEGFRTDIDKNKGDIAAEVKRAGEAEAALSGRLDKLEAIDHDAYVDADSALKTELEGKINAKADASALTESVDALEDADAELAGKIEALEAKFGEGDGSVGDLIADAVAAEALRVDGELDKKVDKVDGKGLSTNDLTDALKGQYDAAYTHSQVAHAPADAQANIIEGVKVNGTAVTVTNKVVDITVPTDNAELTNGAGYLVATDIADKADKATTLAGYGITDAYTTAQVDNAIATEIAKFVEVTDAEINALFGIATA